jgi:hypothetical protein
LNYVDWVDVVCRGFAAARSSSDKMVGWRQLLALMDLPEEAGDAVYQAIEDLDHVGMLDAAEPEWIRDTQNTRAIRGGASIRELWPDMTAVSLDPEQEAFLLAAIARSEQDEDRWALMTEVQARDIFADLEWAESGHSMYDIATSLDAIGLIDYSGMSGGYYGIRPTYRGVVRATQRVNTVWQSRIEAMVEEWETTSVEFKEQVPLGTEKRNAEFARDITALANTKASGHDRHLIIGFEDETRTFTTPVADSITQNRLEQVLNGYANPAPEVRYFTVDHPSGTGAIGVIEVHREPARLPHRLKRGGGKLTPDQIFVRHGSQVEEPTSEELHELIREGERARSSA